MAVGKKNPAKEIKRLMGQGHKPSQIIADHPELASGFDELLESEVTRRAKSGPSRGSGPSVPGSPASPGLEINI